MCVLFCWRLEIYSSLKLGGSTVWNLSPNRLRGGWSDLGTTQATNRAISTVWNLSPNKLRSDLTWGLPKLQIGLFNSLESQSKQVEE
jgi:hypothetical protein